MGIGARSIISLYGILYGNRSPSSRYRTFNFPIPLRNQLKNETLKRLLHHLILHTPRLSNGFRKYRRTRHPRNNLLTFHSHREPIDCYDTNGTLRIQKENKFPSRFHSRSNKRILINSNRTGRQRRTFDRRNIIPRNDSRNNNNILLNLPHHVLG